MESLSKRGFLNGLYAAAKARRVPQYAIFELSYACNLTCAHCFNPTHSASSRELSRDEIFRILAQSAEIGTLDVCFTGGEPTLRPGFFDILERSRTFGLTASMNTNATLITTGTARRLEDAGLGEAFVSIYGATTATYEAVTGVPGSHAAFLAGLEALCATDIPVTLQMPVMTLNQGEAAAAKEFARSRGLAFLPSLDIYPRQDGDPAPLRRRLSPSEKVAVARELGVPASSCRAAASAEFVDCDCGKTQFAVTPYGEMNLCTIFPIPKYDLRHGSVREGWEALKKTVDDAAPGASYECPSCDLKSHCRQGRADAWLEAGDMSPCLPHYEELARLEKENDDARELAGRIR
jgi:radical SAM protein with 4Fe4S-binding SPASM domain